MSGASLKRAVLPITWTFAGFAQYLAKRPPAAERGREWRHDVPRGHLSGSRTGRVGADLQSPGAVPSRSRFVHGFTSAYSVATTDTASTGVQGCRERPRAPSTRRHMSQQRTGLTDGPDFPDLPEATVARLPEYLRALHNLAEAGH